MRVRAVTLALLSSALAAQSGRPDPVTFEKTVLSLLEVKSAKCHSRSTGQAGLEVRNRAGLLQGGTSGPAIVIGAPDKSRLYQRALCGQMPLVGPRLSENELTSVRAWIERGAVVENGDTSASVPVTSPEDRAQWAFQGPKRPTAPRVKNTVPECSPIDAFVLAELEKKKLSFSSASR